MDSTVDIHGAAEIMKIHPQTVRDMINAGEIGAAKVGKAYVMMTKDILRYVENAIIRQTEARMRSPTKALMTKWSRAGSHSASAS